MELLGGGEVTWLECILNRNLLTKHLLSPNPDPPASTLLTQFVVNADKWGNENADSGVTESDPADQIKSSRSRKNRLLKLMAMQTAAYLSWDLDLFGTKLPIGVQNSLMNHLLAVSAESESEKINASKFLQSLYHRWVIRSSQINKSTRTNNRVQNPVLLQSDQFGATDSIIASLDVEKSLDYLKTLVLKAEPGTGDDNQRILIPTQETFSGAQPNWAIGTEIEDSYFASMIHLDVGIYLLYEGNTPDAIHHFTRGQKIPTENFPFFKITKAKLEGYLRALGLVSSFDQTIEDRKVFIPVLDKAGTEEVTRILLDADFQKLTVLTKALGSAGQSSKKENGTDCFSGYLPNNENSFYSRLPSQLPPKQQLNGKFKKNVKVKEEPMEIAADDNGMMIEDIEEAISENDSIYTKYMREQLKKSDPTTKAKYEFVVKSFDTWTKADPRHRENYDVIFHKLANSVESKIDTVPPPGKVVEKTEAVSLDFQQLLKEREEEEAQLLMDNDEEIKHLDPNAQLYSETSSADGDDQLQLMECEMKLFSANNLDSIKQLVITYNKLSQGKSIMSQNLTDWDLPVPIVHAEEHIPAGIFRDSIHMMMVVGRQSFKTENFEAARSAFQMAINELEESVRQGSSSWGFAQYTVRKLSQMLEWEILLTDITEMHTHWTSGTNPAKYSRIVDRSLACLRCLHQNSDVSPRSDIVDSILLALINLGEYQHVIRFDEQQKRWPFMEFLGLLARGCMDLADKKDISASYRDLWNILLPLCMNTTSVKRHSGKDGALAKRNELVWVFDRTCSHTLFSLLVSALCKLHNNILDDVSLQIHTEYLHIWPNIIDDVTTGSSRVSGSSKFNVRQVRDFILHLLDRAIIVGGELLWWRCLGDVQLASENPSGALKCYVEQLAVLTDFFEKHTSVHWQDNQLFRRMIKCCEQMQCFTQAVILCQFLTDVDYSVAFGMAQEKVTLDAQDSLYAFIWDLTILEFLVNLHTKRNEFGKRQIAVKMLGLLELNANNNEEIQREATNLRKSQFMRGLAKRYIVR